MALTQTNNNKNKREYDRESYIMIVDDDQTLLKFFKIHLNKFFSRVIVVKSAKEALDTMKVKEIDLVLSDLRMPKVDGIALLEKIYAANPAIPLYLISGALIEEDTRKDIDRIADGFLKKPFTVEEIHEFIDNGMRRRDILKAISAMINNDHKLLRELAENPKAKFPKIKAKDQQEQFSQLFAELHGIKKLVA